MSYMGLQIHEGARFLCPLSDIPVGVGYLSRVTWPNAA